MHELRTELITYFERFIEEQKKKQKNKKPKKEEKLIEELLLEKITDQNWLSTLAYLADIFETLNKLNVQMQGRQMNCFVFWNKLEAFQKKLAIWKDEVASNDFSSFPRMNELLTENAVKKFI